MERGLKPLRRRLTGLIFFFEAPTRAEETITELSTTKPKSDICVVRELSKKFEQVLKFKGENWPLVKKDLNFKGEFVILFHNPESMNQSSGELRALAEEIMEKGSHPKQMAKILALILNRPVKEIYTELISHKKD